MAHDPHTHDRRDREVIVERGGGAGPGAVIAAIVAVVLLALLAWFLFTNFVGGGETETDVNVPERLDVNIDQGDQGGGQGGQGGGQGGQGGGQGGQGGGSQ